MNAFKPKGKITAGNEKKKENTQTRQPHQSPPPTPHLSSMSRVNLRQQSHSGLSPAHNTSWLPFPTEEKPKSSTQLQGLWDWPHFISDLPHRTPPVASGAALDSSRKPRQLLPQGLCASCSPGLQCSPRPPRHTHTHTMQFSALLAS